MEYNYLYYTLYLKQTIYNNGILKPLETSNYPSNPSTPPIVVSGKTTNRLEEIKTYNISNPYIIGINGVTDIIDNYIHYTIDGIDFITDILTLDTTYKISGLSASNSNTNQNVVKDERDIYDDKTEVVNNIFVERNEISIFNNIYKMSRVNTLDDIAFLYN